MRIEPGGRLGGASGCLPRSMIECLEHPEALARRLPRLSVTGKPQVDSALRAWAHPLRRCCLRRASGALRWPNGLCRRMIGAVDVESHPTIAADFARLAQPVSDPGLCCSAAQRYAAIFRARMEQEASRASPSSRHAPTSGRSTAFAPASLRGPITPRCSGVLGSWTRPLA